MDEQREPEDAERRIEARIEALIERHADERIAGGQPDLDAMAGDLPSGPARARFRARALAQEYLMRRTDGDEVPLDPYLARLSGPDEREQFQQVLRDAELARAHVADELAPGTLLDARYEILRTVGRGGMGTVYSALDHELEREVAIKVLRLPPDARGSDWTELFRRESRTLARLASPSIVTIHDARRGVEHSYIVMDLVRGKDLLSVLDEVQRQRARLGPRAAHGPEPLRLAVGRSSSGERADLLGERTHARGAARILREIALTLEHAHGAGVIHRDLKPQNVMLVPGGVPVLLDFGLASWGEEGSEQGFRGTPEYMAPEQIEHMRAGNDPRTDVYQLGLVLYEMLVLRRAYARRSREDLWSLFRRIQEGEAEPVATLAPWVPRALAAIVAKAMARDPARRYQDMRALREDLERFLAGLPPEHVELPVALRAGMRASHLARRPITAVTAALAVAGVLWLRTPPWVPPVLKVLKADAGEVVELEEGQSLVLSDGGGVLGLDVLVEDSTWLYVFQLFGEGDDRSAQYLRPVFPQALEAYLAGEPLQDAHGIELEPGAHRLACAELVTPKAYEGLLVFASPAEDAALAEWQRTLLEVRRMDGLDVPFEEAEQHLENLAASERGDPLGTISLEARRRAFGNVKAAKKEGTIPRKYQFLHRVELLAGAPASR